MNAVFVDPADQLRGLMNDQERREVECQGFLHHAHALLMPPMSAFIQRAREQQGMAGRSDYLLVCEVEQMERRRQVFLWEVKAPQLSPFEVVTQNRLGPSDALVDAENQLLYYLDECRGSDAFRDTYQIRHPDDVKFGGVIIGRDDNLVSGPLRGVDPGRLPQMASYALRLRTQHFYRSELRILTWDAILRAMAPRMPVPVDGVAR